MHTLAASTSDARLLLCSMCSERAPDEGGMSSGLVKYVSVRFLLAGVINSVSPNSVGRKCHFCSSFGSSVPGRCLLKHRFMDS